MAAEDWFEALGQPVHPSQRQAALALLMDEGYDQQECALVLTVVAREIEHDQPLRAMRVLRSHLGRQNETLVVRTLATIACPTKATLRHELIETLKQLAPTSP